MYEIKKGIKPPSETKYPWDEMEVLDCFDCDACELETLRRSERFMAKKRYGFKIEIARYGDVLSVWLLDKGIERPQETKQERIKNRIVDVLSLAKGSAQIYVAEGIIHNRIRWASTGEIKNCLQSLVDERKIFRKLKLHPKRKTESFAYRVQ